jgi:hypothetical protein
MEVDVDDLAGLVAAGFLTFLCYSFWRLWLRLRCRRNGRLELTNRRQQTGGQEPKKLIPSPQDGRDQ